MSPIIPGIHNYCDRWCERCPFSARCALFEMEQELPEAAFDTGSEVFFDTISNRLNESLQLVREEAARWNVQEPSEQEEAGAWRSREALRARTTSEPLMQECEAYAERLQDFFAQAEVWEQKTSSLREQARLGIKSRAAGVQEFQLVEDCFHVLRWYHHFIGAKFYRALEGLWEGIGESLDPQSDANGSAKVGLMGVDRSRLALRSLYNLLDGNDTVLDLLALLDRIGRLANERFPLAQQFRRPGFDDPVD